LSQEAWIGRWIRRAFSYLLLHPRDRGLAGVAGAVVDDPVDGAGRGVGLAAHHLGDEASERLDPGFLLDAVEQVGVVDIPGGEVGERAVAAVVELEPGCASGSGRQRSVAAAEGLQLRLLIGADHVLVGSQSATLEAALVEVEHRAGLPGEAGIAREDPAALLPRLQGIVVQPAPDRRGGRLGHAPLDDEPVQLSTREAGKGQAMSRR
jgi:hypothetical protein